MWLCHLPGVYRSWRWDCETRENNRQHLVVDEHNRDTNLAVVRHIQLSLWSLSQRDSTLLPQRHHGPTSLSRPSSSNANANIDPSVGARACKRHTHTSSLPSAPHSLLHSKAILEIPSPTFFPYPTDSTRTDAQREEPPLGALAQTQRPSQHRGGRP